MEKASGGSFARVTRKTDEDEGGERFGHDAKQIPGFALSKLSEAGGLCLNTDKAGPFAYEVFWRRTLKLNI